MQYLNKKFSIAVTDHHEKPPHDALRDEMRKLPHEYVDMGGVCLFCYSAKEHPRHHPSVRRMMI